MPSTSCAKLVWWWPECCKSLRQTWAYNAQTWKMWKWQLCVVTCCALILIHQLQAIQNTAHVDFWGRVKKPPPLYFDLCDDFQTFLAGTLWIFSLNPMVGGPGLPGNAVEALQQWQKMVVCRLCGLRKAWSFSECSFHSNKSELITTLLDSCYTTPYKDVHLCHLLLLSYNTYTQQQQYRW